MNIEREKDRRGMDLEERVSALKALADTSRIRVVNALLEKPHCAEELSERLRLAPSTISFHLRRLEDAGLVTKSKTQYYAVYALRADLLQMSLKDFVTVPSADDGAEKKRMDRYRDRILRTFFRDGVLVQMPKQWRKRRIILDEFAASFEPGREYREEEVNERIMPLFEDYCTIRRMLIDEGYMTRTGQMYRRLERECATMDERSELKKQYKETPKKAGIFQVKNTVNGRVLLGSSKNLHGPINKHRFLLSTGSHWNKKIQADWNRYGPDAFTFEILDVLKQKDDPAYNLEDELALLEEIWIERVRPFGGDGYNEKKSIRE